MLFVFIERAFFIPLNWKSIFFAKFLNFIVFFSQYSIHLPLTLTENGKETAHIHFYYFKARVVYHYYFYDDYPLGVVVCYNFPPITLPALEQAQNSFLINKVLL